MKRSTNRSPRPALMFLAGISMLASGCEEAPQPANHALAAPANTVEATPTVPLPMPLPDLTRRDLISAAALAADAVASGTAVAPANAALLGRSFELRLPFGCDGPSDDDAQWAGWSLNPDSGALKVQARSELSADEPWVRSIAGATAFEAAEGFWVRRPWTSADSCPVLPAAATEPEEAQTLALLQLFPADASRTRQRGGRPYTSTIKTAAEARDRPRAFHLLLEGRVTGFADRQPVHCTQASPALRPRCAFAVEFTRIAFEDESGGVVAEWRY